MSRFVLKMSRKMFRKIFVFFRNKCKDVFDFLALVPKEIQKLFGISLGGEDATYLLKDDEPADNRHGRKENKNTLYDDVCFEKKIGDAVCFAGGEKERKEGGTEREEEEGERRRKTPGKGRCRHN